MELTHSQATPSTLVPPPRLPPKLLYYLYLLRENLQSNINKVKVIITNFFKNKLQKPDKHISNKIRKHTNKPKRLKCA